MQTANPVLSRLNSLCSSNDFQSMVTATSNQFSVCGKYIWEGVGKKGGQKNPHENVQTTQHKNRANQESCYTAVTETPPHTCTIPESLILVAEEGVLQLSSQSAVFNTVMLSPENSNDIMVHSPNVCSVSAEQSWRQEHVFALWAKLLNCIAFFLMSIIITDLFMQV